MQAKRSDVAFLSILALFTGTAILWLALGILPAVAASSTGLHDLLHSWGRGTSVFSEIARNATGASHSVGSWPHVATDYAFSAINIGLAALVVKLRPRNSSARLLAFGLIGTAVAFNLQGHDALQTVPVETLGMVDLWHVSTHFISGLAYVFALVLFPDGQLPKAGRLVSVLRIPLLGVLILVTMMFSLVATDDHTLGLVFTFGLFVPAAGVAAQLGRWRSNPEQTQKQTSKLLVWALLFAFLVAVPLVIFTTSATSAPKRTIDYEIALDEPGLLFFRCDPHPDDMVGEVEVVARGEAPSVVPISAQESRFDKDKLVITAGEMTTIRFTNNDSDLHNVSIYKDRDHTEPVFIGAEISGSSAAVFAFRTFRVVLSVIPVALLIGLVRFRLWSIEKVINRTLVYSLLAAVVTLLYIATVVGLGAVIGAGTRLNLVLSIALTAVIAVAFQPLRERARRFANRLVYGERANPYEVLHELSDRMGKALALDEVLPRMAETIGRATGASRADVWLKVGDTLTRAVSWPTDTPDAINVPIHKGELPFFENVDRTVPVEHQGRLLGAITVVKPPGESLTEVEDRLLEGVAAQAGLALENAQLNAELQQRLVDLRDSRNRLVTAQDGERRRIERDIHDGAQQHLVALSAKLSLARALVPEDERMRSLLVEVQGDAGDALSALRDLARGIYPPLLADKGLVHALEAHARRCAVPVNVSDKGVGRYSSEIESAVYFCCLEAIQNAVKHGSPPITLRLGESDGCLKAEIADSGPGFDETRVARGSGLQNMSDRISAIGGSLAVTSSEGTRTTVTASVPVPH